MRFLAHGGAPRAERVRIGNWPEIPSGLLLDVRGPAANAPAFGLGVLQGHPYLIYRELQGECAYSFLLEPRREDYELFRWNGAWMLATLLADPDARRLLITEPEQATEHSLEHVLDRCTPIPLTDEGSAEVLAGLLTRAALESDRFTASMTGVTMDPRTPLVDFAGALHKVPIAFRTGRGWLVRGVESHAGILGCALLFEGPSNISADPMAGFRALARLEHIAATNQSVADLLATPFPEWDARGQSLMHGLRMLEQLDTRTAQTWDLLQSVPAREGLLKGEIRAAALRTMERSRQELPFEPATLLLEDAEAGNRTLTPDVVARLDHGALMRFFTTRNIPPDPWPDWMETPRQLKSELWIRVIESAAKDWADLSRGAFADLTREGEPDAAVFAVVAAGIAKARDAGTGTFEWADFASYPELRTLIANWTLESVKQMRGDWQTAYLLLGEDPGGHALARSNVAAPIAARLVTWIWDALAGPHGDRARVWLDALATSPLRDTVPLGTKLELAVTAGARWTAIERLRQAYEGETVMKGEPASAEERPYLLRELEELAQTPTVRAPDPVALRAVLGTELPESTQRVLSRLRAERAEKATPSGWLKIVAQRLKEAAPTPEAKAEAKAKVEAKREEKQKARPEPREEVAAKPAARSGYFMPPKKVEAPPPKPVEVVKSIALPPPTPKPVEVAKPVAPPKPVEVAKPVAPPPPPPKPVEVVKPVALPPPPPKPVEVAKPVAPPPPPPKPVEVVKPVVPPPPPPKPVEVVKPVVPPPPPPKPVEVVKPVAPPQPPPKPVEVVRHVVPEPNLIELNPVAATPPAPVPTPVAAVVEYPVRPDLREKLRVWIAGGNVDDDRAADEELIKLFEGGNPNELAASRTIIEGFGPGLLYRLSGRSIANPRLLDGIARVLGNAALDRVVRDAAHYDILRFAKVAAARLGLNHADGWSGAVDQAVIRLLRAGNNELRKELNRELMQMDPTLIEELQRVVSPAARSSEDAA